MTDEQLDDSRHSAFFYGTLMHPQFLCKVIQSNGSHLEVAPAIIHGYAKHHVCDASFPGIIPLEISVRFFNSDPEKVNRVEGIAVRGLTNSDMRHIEYFEGNYYKSIFVFAQPLAPFEPIARAVEPDYIRHLEDWDYPITTTTTLPAIRLQTYIWNTPLNHLSPDIWSFKTFVKEKLKIWM